MSWSVNAVGKPQKVAEKLRHDFDRIQCSEPEESIKNNARTAIEMALDAFPPNCAVHVQASGSQYVPDANVPGEAINSLNMKIEPIYGFIE